MENKYNKKPRKCALLRGVRGVLKNVKTNIILFF